MGICSHHFHSSFKTLLSLVFFFNGEGYTCIHRNICQFLVVWCQTYASNQVQEGSTITQKVRKFLHRNPIYNDRVTLDKVWFQKVQEDNPKIPSSAKCGRAWSSLGFADRCFGCAEHLSSKQGTTTPSLKNVRKGVLKEIGVWQMLNNCLVCVDWCIIFFSLSDSCVSNCRRVYEWNVKFSPLKSSLPSLWFGAESHKLFATLVVYSISRLSPSGSSLKWKLQNYSQLDLFVFYGPFNFPITHQNISAKWTLNCL